MQRPGDPAGPGQLPLVSVILPVHNAELWLDACLESVLQQDFQGTMELSVFNDASKDKSMTIIEKWRPKLEDSGILVVIGGHESPSPRGVSTWSEVKNSTNPGCGPQHAEPTASETRGREAVHLPLRMTAKVVADHDTACLVTSSFGLHGRPLPVGYSKNQAIAQSSGSYLCFLDSDDVMMPERVRLQHEAAVQHPTSIVGCRVRRDPPGSTERYTRWINRLAPEQLLTQVLTANGPTVIMPTWFCSRAWFSHVGPFDEGGQGVPEDLLFFYQHLRKGGRVLRVDQTLLLYRYHPQAATLSVLETTIWTHRVCFLEEWALPQWASFTIWNAGKQGRRLYRSLTAASRCKVVAFCDVDENKIRKGFYCYEEAQERPKPRVPVLHFRAARPPFVLCVKLLTAVAAALVWSERSATQAPGPNHGLLGTSPHCPWLLMASLPSDGLQASGPQGHRPALG
ncbi:queuosine-tRNA galactosyltransferase isoform X2 [Urocitellus parryii]|uniref:UDP-GlcNAc:betaGal beta-1,3-N-acetylglucosaminyltransferase-like protein 1 isoform X2 n=1 Tax=Urocitellus parryii TaxID=9999 RepID=UPI000E560D24|nr:UDP-GlcNAc:betaGal beta-1,3-N-acetylglucosaminyltransferase-like protein 1 isoform X2 [Urocitellus parryii]